MRSADHGHLRTVRLGTGHRVTEQKPEAAADAVLRLVRRTPDTRP